MKLLSLLRHAQAIQLIEGHDFDRHLSQQGIDDARCIAHKLIRCQPQPDRLIASPAMRTRQTALLVAEALNIPITEIIFEPALYATDSQTYWQILRRQSPIYTHLVMVGHNPEISQFATQLHEDTGSVLALKTAQVALFESPIQSWSAIQPRNGRGHTILAPDCQ